MLKFRRNDQKITRTKEEQRERLCCGIRLQFIKYTVWPQNGNARRLTQRVSKCINKIVSPESMSLLCIKV